MDIFCKRCLSKKSLQMHHIIPKSMGGSNEENNLIELCIHCHKEWHSLDSIYFMNFKSWIVCPVQYEKRDSIMCLTKKSLKKKKEAGLVYSGIPPFGFDNVEGKLVENIDDQNAIFVMVTSYRKKKSFAYIARELTKLDYKTKTGVKWSKATVYKILHRHFQDGE